MACVHTVWSNQISRGASGSISLNGYFNAFVPFIVSRASSEYISERLDGSTHFQFAMPWRPDSLNCRPDWTSSLTVICGPSTCITKRGCISSTARSSSPPLPGSGLPLASLTIPGKGGIPTGSPLNARPKKRSHATPTMLSNMQRTSRRATPS